MAWWEAFSSTGPGRPPAIEDVYDPDFDAIFGPEPRVTGGRRVNLRDLTAISQWRQSRREWDGIADFELDADVLDSIMTSTGGIPVAWQSTNGKTYLAVIGIETPVFRFPVDVFDNPNIGDPVAIIWQSILRKGGVLNLPAEGVGDHIRRLNKRNMEARG